MSTNSVWLFPIETARNLAQQKHARAGHGRCTSHLRVSRAEGATRERHDRPPARSCHRQAARRATEGVTVMAEPIDLSGFAGWVCRSRRCLPLMCRPGQACTSSCGPTMTHLCSSTSHLPVTQGQGSDGAGRRVAGAIVPRSSSRVP